MATKSKPKAGWSAGALVSGVTFKARDVEALCRAAGVDPEGDRRARGRVLARVARAIGTYRAEQDGENTSPRPTHQRAAIARVEAACAALVGALTDLDDLSRETLQDAQRGFFVAAALTAARSWSGTATTALHALDGHTSRGRVPAHARQILLALLRAAFRQAADPEDGNLAEFLQCGCSVAGVRLSDRQAQRVAAQHDRQIGR